MDLKQIEEAATHHAGDIEWVGAAIAYETYVTPHVVVEMCALIRKQEQALIDRDLALMEQTELADRCRKQAETLEAERDRMQAERNSKQAEIDRLMLEFCPDEMSSEQMAEWESRQRKATAHLPRTTRTVTSYKLAEPAIPVQAGMPAVTVAMPNSIDRDAFWILIAKLKEAHAGAEYHVARTDLIAHIDAHTTQAVAAERDRCAKLATQWGMARMPEGGGNALFNFAEAVRLGVTVDERDTDYHWSKSPVSKGAAPQQHAQAAPVTHNPWTGKPRDQRDITSDPWATLCLEPGKPILAEPCRKEDLPFYDFWYSHMVNDQMTGALEDIAHSTARYIWDAAVTGNAQAALSETQSLLEREQRDAQTLATLLRKERERFQFLHSTNKDADGWEWGVARVRVAADGRVEYLWGVSDHSDIDAIIASQKPAEAPIPSLFDRKLSDLQQRGYEVIGRILHKDGQYALFDSSCRWLSKENYQRLMHEQNGSLFAAAPAIQQEGAALDADIQQIINEVNEACAMWPPFNSAHEGFAVLKEEVDELWDHVKVNQKRRDLTEMKKEAKQVSAMALRFMRECCDEITGRK